MMYRLPFLFSVIKRSSVVLTQAEKKAGSAPQVLATAATNISHSQLWKLNVKGCGVLKKAEPEKQCKNIYRVECSVSRKSRH